MSLLRTFILFAILVPFSIFSNNDWKLYSPPQSSYDVSDIVSCGNSLFGLSDYSLVTSVDGVNWSYIFTDEFYITDLYSNGEQLIVIKSSNEVMVSLDNGLTFNTSGQLYSRSNSFIFKNIRFAISDSSLYAFDLNDSDYIEVCKTTNLLMPAATNDIFTLSHSGHDDRLLYTTNGYDWKTATLPIAGIIKSTDSLFILSPRNVSFIDDVYISKNAVDWVNVKDSTQFAALVGLRTLIQLKDDSWLGFTRKGKRITSDDGINWVSHSFTNDWLNPGYIVETDSLIIQQASLDCYYSTDNGETFNVHEQCNMRDVYSICSAGEIGLIGTKYCGLTSSNTGGCSWYELGTETNYVPGHDIAKGNGLYISVGSKGRWAFSTDAINWQIRNEEQLSDNSYGSSVSWSGEYFTWIGARNYPLKLEGDSWIACTTDSIIHIYCHVWGNGTMVGVGRSNLIYVGNDIKNLDILELPEEIKDLKAVHHNGTFFVAVGELGTILKSYNGRDWDKALNAPVTTCLNGVYWTGKEWCVIGDDGIILYSLDGESWTEDKIPNKDDLTSIGVHDSKLFIGGKQLYYKDIENDPVMSMMGKLKKVVEFKVTITGSRINIKTDLNGKLDVKLFDLKGREVFRSQGRDIVNGNVSIAIKNFNHASNVFIAELSSNGCNYRKQIIVLK